jgi:outer membrane protein insertion porin family
MIPKSKISTTFCFAALLFLSAFLPGIVFGQVADSTRQLIVENIEIVGNSKTKPGVIFRYLTIRPGDAITPATIDENHRRLAQTNFFKEVDFYTRPGSQKGKLILVIEIQERRWPYFQFEGGHSDLNGWYFVPASLRFDNLFGGGHLLGVRWLLGDRISKLSLGFRANTLLDDHAFLDIELFAGNQDFIHYLGSDRASQKVPFGGLQLQVGGNRGVFKHLYLAYRVENYEPEAFIKLTETDSTISNLPADLADDLGKTQIGALEAGLYGDFRDHPVYPLRGFWGALSIEAAQRGSGSDIKFGKVTVDARFYQRVMRRQVLAFHVKGGYVGERAPFYERFYLGGANSLRGFDDRRLTPIGWGTKLILTNTEFRFPLTSKNFPNHKVSGVLFFDAGGIWQPGQNPNFDDVFAAAGFGFRVRLPVFGITRFDFSFPLNPVDNNDFQFHISLGQTF